MDGSAQGGAPGAGGALVAAGGVNVTTGGATAGGAMHGGSDAGPETGDADAPEVDGGSESGVPGPLATFERDVRALSDEVADSGYPYVCTSAVPPVRVDSPAEVDQAVAEYVSAVLGVPVSDLSVDPQECGGANYAPCANIFQNDMYHLGGPLPRLILPLAERIDQEATSVTLATITPTRDGISLPAVVVLAGIRDGWLMAIVGFGDETCLRE